MTGRGSGLMPCPVASRETCPSNRVVAATGQAMKRSPYLFCFFEGMNACLCSPSTLSLSTMTYLQ
ncbi:MAG TPA: hypothetical protein VL485_05185 [Ktedonobacteraceae bacterium]|nr:hypothetical protein [Ktedonobacteraceae bacterium]